MEYAKVVLMISQDGKYCAVDGDKDGYGKYVGLERLNKAMNKAKNAWPFDGFDKEFMEVVRTKDDEDEVKRYEKMDDDMRQIVYGNYMENKNGT